MRDKIDSFVSLSYFMQCGLIYINWGMYTNFFWDQIDAIFLYQEV